MDYHDNGLVSEKNHLDIIEKDQFDQQWDSLHDDKYYLVAIKDDKNLECL